MENETRESPEAITHALDPLLLERELASLQGVLRQPITEKRFNDWIDDIRVRTGTDFSTIFSNTIWGTIRWKKAIGRPLAPTLASAFVIEHIHWDTVMDVTPDGRVKYVDILAPHKEPSKWDGPDDADYYRVSFMTETPQRPTRIRVNFAAQVGWGSSHPIFLRSSFRDITPSERYFLKGDKLSILDPFEVVKKSILMGTVED
jgi:hypothetical protein